MPLYDFKCYKCEKIFEGFKKISELNPQCSCGGDTTIVLNTKGRDWFKPHWNENIDEKPIYVESKNHYKKLCQERGLFARCLM